MKKIFLSVLCFSIAGVIGWYAFAKSAASAPPPLHVKTVIEEIISIGELYRGPQVDSGLTELAYTCSMSGGRGMAIVNLQTGAEERFVHTNQMLRIFEYSPDGRYLLFRDLNRGVSERLLLRDRLNNKVIPIKENKGILAEIVWLTTNTLAAAYRKEEETFICRITLQDQQQIVQRVKNTNGVGSLISLSSNSIAYIDFGNIWKLDFDTEERTQLSKLTKADMKSNKGAKKLLRSDFMWLNYQPATKQFLFCSSDDSNWRHLFHFDSTSNQVTQLTFDDEHSYNGKWIQQGKGTAYVGNLTNHFYLAVRPDDTTASTNLFWGGHVYGFTVSADGSKLFAAASVKAEPPEIWEYDIGSRQLRQITHRAKLKTVKVIPRQEQWVASFDGLKIPHFILPPLDLEKRKKYPAVISAPPDGSQFHDAWENYSQFLGNIGCFHIAVNHRGIDGYGNKFKKSTPEESYQDVMAVYNELKKNPNIDLSRVFLMTFCGGSAVINYMAHYHPELWKGIITISGAPVEGTGESEELPKQLLFVGKRDNKGLIDQNKTCVEKSHKTGAPVRLLMAPRTGHEITDSDIDRKLAVEIGQFIFEQHYSEIFPDYGVEVLGTNSSKLSL